MENKRTIRRTKNVFMKRKMDGWHGKSHANCGKTFFDAVYSDSPWRQQIYYNRILFY